ISRLVHHITTEPVHPIYYPFLRFGALHASRTCLVWAAATKTGGSRRKVGRLQDLFGYLVATWGGGTLLSLLTSQPPAWLISSTPWLIYIPIYFLLIPSGMANYMTSTAPTFINIIGAYFDGIARGIVLTSLPDLLASSPRFASAANPWTVAVLSGIAACGGGWMVQTFNLPAAQWSIGSPSILSGTGPFILESLELWAVMLCSVVYCSLMRIHPSLSPISNLITPLIPRDLVSISAKASGNGPLVDAPIAWAFAIIILGSLYASKVITKLIMDSRSKRR
ncbi:hypothetical protein BD324DRAFT_569248, partial [Kockovaella imperatae]